MEALELFLRGAFSGTEGIEVSAGAVVAFNFAETALALLAPAIAKLLFLSTTLA